MTSNSLMTTVVFATLVTTSAFSQIDSSRAEVDTLNERLNQHLEELLDHSDISDESPIKDFVAESTTSTSSSSHFLLRSRIAQRLQVPEGYSDGTYSGSRLKMYNRLLLRMENYSAGLLMAKDPGERNANDFFTANLSYRGSGVISSAIAGDFHLEGGQGIALWRGAEYGKGSDVVESAMKHGRGSLSAVSADEVKFLRGGAVTLSVGKTSATLFASDRSLGATVDSSGGVTSLYTSGYYRTTSEQAKRNSLRERMIGIRMMTIVFAGHELGMTFYHTGFSRTIMLQDGRRFMGNTYSLISVDHDFRFPALDIFGEWVLAQSTVGGIAGLRFRPSRSVRLAASFRSYPPEFVSLHGNGFGEGSEMFNEQGLYFGADLALTRTLSISCYADRFTFLQSTSSSSFSITGHDLCLRVQSTRLHGFRFGFQYLRNTRISRDTPVTSGELFLGRTPRLVKINARGDVEYHLSTNVDFRLRLEKTLLRDDAGTTFEQGLMCYCDLVIHHGRIFLSNFRLIFFRTDSYSTRLSEYERDLDGITSVPLLYGSGVRWYLLFRYKLVSFLSIAVKYSDLLRDDVRSIGSGPDALTTNHDNRVSAQIDVEF